MMMMIGLPVFGFWGATVDVGWLRSPPPHSGHNLRQHSTYTRTHFPRRGSAINKTIGSIAHKIPSSIIKCMQYMYVLGKHNTTCSIVYLYKYWDILESKMWDSLYLWRSSSRSPKLSVPIYLNFIFNLSTLSKMLKHGPKNKASQSGLTQTVARDTSQWASAWTEPISWCV